MKYVTKLIAIGAIYLSSFCGSMVFGQSRGDYIVGPMMLLLESEERVRVQTPISPTSYDNFKSIGLTPNRLPNLELARTYGNFNGSGNIDLFTARITYWPPTTIGAATPSLFEFWSKRSDGTYVRRTHLLGNTVGCIHPRKAITADFNNDGFPDVFVSCTGFDAFPFPGEKNRVLLSQPDGTYISQDASEDVGYFHGATSMDFNGDGFIDIAVVNAFDLYVVYVLLNQGDGTFQRESFLRFPASIEGNPFSDFSRAYYTIELVDIDEDGNKDVLLGGHDYEGAPTIALLNPGNNNFRNVTPIELPAVPNEGVVLDFVVEGSGEDRAIWVLRTSGGDGTFYESKTVQKVLWSDLSSTIPLNERPGRWIPWIIPTNISGQPVITSDDDTAGIEIPR